MSLQSLLGFRPIVISVRSRLDIETVRDIISESVSKRYAILKRNPEKLFYGREYNGVFYLKSFTIGRNSFKPQIKISLTKDDKETLINVEVGLESFVTNAVMIFMLIGLAILINGVLRWRAKSETVGMVIGAILAVFPWFMAKLGYEQAVDQAESSIKKVFRKLRCVPLPNKGENTYG